VATVNYPEPPPPWRSRGSGYTGKLTKGRGTRSRRWWSSPALKRSDPGNPGRIFRNARFVRRTLSLRRSSPISC